MQIYKDEIFGPVLVVLRAESLEEAIELILQLRLQLFLADGHDGAPS